MPHGRYLLHLYSAHKGAYKSHCNFTKGSFSLVINIPSSVSQIDLSTTLYLFAYIHTYNFIWQYRFTEILCAQSTPYCRGHLRCRLTMNELFFHFFIPCILPFFFPFLLPLFTHSLGHSQGLEGGPDPAFPLLFHKNPASRTLSWLSRIPFFLSEKKIH